VGTSTDPDALQIVDTVQRIPVQQQRHGNDLAGETHSVSDRGGSGLAGETKSKTVDDIVNRPVPRPRRVLKPPDRFGQGGLANVVTAVEEWSNM
jgi:hypothetical protein